ncbi:hypothetical protein [Paenibacillus tuaregi]|uniref:hypothetical protein n=1 Tax=Paenibacillus tuaregi TaxID=1816681 RepID=UPI000B218D9B|nr:hypothetical protein [Paenibacillus tuaregi]
MDIASHAHCRCFVHSLHPGAAEAAAGKPVAAVDFSTSSDCFNSYPPGLSHEQKMPHHYVPH